MARVWSKCGHILGILCWVHGRTTKQADNWQQSHAFIYNNRSSLALHPYIYNKKYQLWPIYMFGNFKQTRKTPWNLIYKWDYKAIYTVNTFARNWYLTPKLIFWYHNNFRMHYIFIFYQISLKMTKLKHAARGNVPICMISGTAVRWKCYYKAVNKYLDFCTYCSG